MNIAASSPSTTFPRPAAGAVRSKESPRFRILHLEDNPRDAEYIESLLKMDDLFCEITRVEDRENFLGKLESQPPPDIILSDYTLPNFDGLSALNLSREKAADIPFLFVSGSMGEELAVECLKQGAKDYLLKGGLARLAAAVRRALEEAEAEKERRRAQEQLLFNAFHDGLTGLTNRPYFLLQLQEALQRTSKEPDPPLAVAVLGLNDFQTFCDGFGWEAGDSLLRTVAEYIRQEIPSVKVLSRISGKEFGLLFEGRRQSIDLIASMGGLLRSFHRPLLWNKQPIYLTASIGVARASPGCRSAEDMLRNCETALHQAKSSKKPGLVLFDSSMHRQAVDLLESINNLRRAVENVEFCVHYQPIMELATGAVSGFEALVRWQDPLRGLVSPMEFIPTAERIHLISALGDFVMREACQALKRWQSAYPEFSGLCVSVNVSPQQFDTDLYERVRMALEISSLPPSALKLEITESGFMRNPETTVDLMNRLRSLGVGLQIDDFGTGYSCLSYLDRFPMQALKIDRAFVNRIHEKAGNSSIPMAIIDLAHNLGMQVVAEGIETQEQADFLKAKGCEYGQGYLFSKPMTEENVLRYLEKISA